MTPQWQLLSHLFAEAEVGRPREVDIRAVVDAIFYINRTGVQWRYLPNLLLRSSRQDGSGHLQCGHGHETVENR